MLGMNSSCLLFVGGFNSQIRSIFLRLVLVVFALIGNSINAQQPEPVYFSGTGHWYQAVAISPAVCWTQCRDSAIALGGHLATIGTAEENNFVLSLNAPDVETYIGGYEPSVDGIWAWVTGEPWGQFVNWNSGEPNNSGLNYLGMYTLSVSNHTPGAWNDTYDCASRGSFIVEYDNFCSFANGPPVFDSILTDTVEEGSTLCFRVCAADPDTGDSIILQIINPPPNVVFIDSGNGCAGLTFNPDTTQAGTTNLTFVASDLCSTEDTIVVEIVILPCEGIPGDANASGTLSLADIIGTVNYIFNKSGYPSCPANSAFCWLSGLLCRGDWGGGDGVSLSDVIQGVNYFFNKPGGPWNPIPSGACCLPVP